MPRSHSRRREQRWRSRELGATSTRAADKAKTGGFGGGGKTGRGGGKSFKKGPCFKCGSKHLSRDCPDKGDPQMIKPKQAYMAMQEAAPGLLSFFAEKVEEHGLVLQRLAEHEAFMSMAAEMVGKAVVDCGASESIGGVAAIEALTAKLREMQPTPVEVNLDDRPVYGFGNSGRQQVLTTKSLRASPWARRTVN